MDETHALVKKAQDLLKLPTEEAALALDSLSPGEARALLLALPPDRRRQDLALLSRNPAALVRLLPPEDFYATVMETGPEDALTLLELSSNAQLNHLMDLQLWVDRTIDVQRLERWLTLLEECGPARVRRFLEKTDFELLVLWLERSLVLVDREALPDLPSELADRVVSPDGYHHLVVRLGADLEHLRKCVELLFAESRELFMALVGNLGTMPLAELEDNLARWRQGRLADRGWPDPDEALAIHLPRAPEEVTRLSGRLPGALDDPPALPLQVAPRGPRLGAGLAALDDPEIRARVSVQLANLANRVLVMDGRPLDELAQVREALALVSGRIEVGLAELGAHAPSEAAAALTSVPLLHLAQVGLHALLQRHKRARTLTRAAGGHLLAMLEAPLPERLAALAAPRPRIVPGPAALARELASPEDLAALDRDLDRAEAAQALAVSLGLASAPLPEPFPPGSQPARREDLSLEVLLFTQIARDRLGLDPAPAPLPRERLNDLFVALPHARTELAEQLGAWAQGRLGEEAVARLPGLPGLLQALADTAADELLVHAPERLDPRFVGGLWIQANGAGSPSDSRG
jgi:hypothetical protein